VPNCKELSIKFKEKCGDLWTGFKKYFREESGGKTVINLKRTGWAAIISVCLIALVIDICIPRVDRTFYHQTSGRSEFKPVHKEPPVNEAMQRLFAAGKRQVDQDKKQAAEKKRTAINYWAPQIVGDNENGPHAIRSGSKLIGILKAPIDTRSRAPVRVTLTRGGESNGIEIAPGSVLVGSYSYGGDGDRVYLTFARIDPTDNGEPKKIKATALDAGTFTPGIQGDEFTGTGEKVAGALGLTMFSSMTDTLTERESVGIAFNGVQNKPTMKNALLQGMSKASQDQAGRTAASIQGQRGYVLVPEGKEMIIELQEDFK
jgi:hypothetical protein